MANQYYAGLDDTDAIDPTAVVDDVTATSAVTTEETLAAQQQAAQAASALAAQELLAQQQLMMRHHHHMWQRMNGTTFRTRIGTWQDAKAQRLAAMGRLTRVSGAVMTGYAGDLQYRVVNPHGALIRWRDGSLVPNAKPVAPGTIVLGTPRGDGYIVEVSSGGINGWLNALDLEQLTSADPSPVLASGEFAGADGEPGAMMPATGCPSGQVWSEWYGKCVAYIPPPPPSPVSSTHTSGEYVGDGMFPATGCPAGTYWHDYYQKCVPNIPAPPPALPDTFEEWRRQHQTSGEFTGYGWEYEVTGAPAPTSTSTDVQAQDALPPPVVPHAQASNAQHPAVTPNSPAPAHAAANAADANAHAQAAQAVAAHPAAPGSGAEKHAAKAFEHASAATYHAQVSANAQHPHEAHEHAHHAAQHAHMARRHASHLRREGYQRGWNEGVEHHGLFANLFGHPYSHTHGFSRRFHAHPEWHGYGHPAWRRGINPMWAGHRAECAGRSHPRGLFGFLFAWNRRYCAIERIVHPQGWESYRITPAGLQEGALLDDDQTQANQQYEVQAGQPAPDANAGPMPGSDEKAAGAIEPDHTDDDTAGDEGDSDDAADTTTTATKGWFAGFDEPQMRPGADPRRGAIARQARESGMGMGGGRNDAYHGNYGGGGYGDEGESWLSRFKNWRRGAHHHHHHHHDEGMGMPMQPSMPMMPMPQHHEHHDYVQQPMPQAPQPHETWYYGGGTTNPYDPNAQHPLGVTEGY